VFGARDLEVKKYKTTPHVKLAALNVHVFDGNYLERSSFFDIFSALIHDNPTLSLILKFFYLRSALSGDALLAIKCLETTFSNYEVAWGKLSARYNNPKVLVQTHVKPMFDMDSVQNGSAIKLQNFTDVLSVHKRASEELGQNPNT